MTTANIDDPNALTGAQVHGSDGGKLGKVDSVYFDNDTDKPEWAAVKSGLFGSHVSLVPLQKSSWDGSALTVPFDKAALQNAPHHDPDTEISASDEQELYRHYGMDSRAAQSSATAQPAGPGRASGPGQPPGGAAAGQSVGGPDAGRHAEVNSTQNEQGPGDRDRSAQAPVGRRQDRPTTGGESTAGADRRDRSGDAGIQGRDTSGPPTDGAMTRSEEQLRVGTETRETGRARLRKHIVTENVTTTVPVSHEEVTLEREPITGTNRADAMAGDQLTEETHEVTLTAEKVVTSKETVPVERVRMGTETVTEEQQVDATLRKEQIEVEGTERVDATGDRTATGKRIPPTGEPRR